MNKMQVKRLVEASLLEDIQVKSILRPICEDVEFVPTGDQATEFQVGDVIHTNAYYSPSSRQQVRGHYVLVITSKKLENGIIEYEGFAFSSRIQKSNKNSRFSNNLHIDDESTMYQTRSSKTQNRRSSLILRVDDLVKFTNKDLSTGGVWKGKVTDEFMNFVNHCYQNYRSGKDNSKMYWEG